MTASPPGGVEAWLPGFDVRERHEGVIPLPAQSALETALASPVAPDRLVRALLRLRGMTAVDASIEGFLRANRFVRLERAATTLVAGLVVPRGRVNDAESWRAFTGPGIKIAADLRTEPLGPALSRLVTETRVLALDRRSRRRFRLYWVVVGPWSALIRRRWLRAIAARAASVA